jgi:UTP--glucose-1-phosphate uridylyltransferase
MFEKKVDIAVMPVAGLGTRFLPITKAIPKEMVPLINKPLIQYAIDEAYASGIKEIILVTSFGKQAIENYFDRHHELENRLEQLGKMQALSQVRHTIPDDLNIAYLRQSQPKGLGHAIACASHLIGDRPFAVLLADDLLINSSNPGLKQLIDKYQQTQKSCVGVTQVEKDKISNYGVAAVNDNMKIISLVEKPKAEDAVSDLGIIGRYIFTPEIFYFLKEIKPGVGGEIQLTDAMEALQSSQGMYAVNLEGERLDCGTPEGHFLSSVYLSLQEHPELRSKVGAMVDRC